MQSNLLIKTNPRVYTRVYTRAFTLIEMLIFVALLSMLLFGFMCFLYSLNDSSMDLYQKISKAYVE